MEPLEELKIELKRLKRHENFLQKRFSSGVARDLATCLRNFVQMSDVINLLIIEQSWDIRFSKESLPKSLKRLRSNGATMAIPLPGSVQSNGIQISGVVVHNRALSPEEVRQSYETGLSSRPSRRNMSFVDWLNNSVYQVRSENGNKDISRKVFIERSASLLGGTHPMSNFVETEHASWADPYIVGLLSTKIGLWPAPYAILMESAQEIIRAFKEHLN